MCGELDGLIENLTVLLSGSRVVYVYTALYWLQKFGFSDYTTFKTQYVHSPVSRFPLDAVVIATLAI